MQELELLKTLGVESVALITIALMIILLLKPKDKQLEDKTTALFEKNKQIDSLLETNRDLAEQTKVINENISHVVRLQTESVTKLVSDVGSISRTMEKISDEMTVLAANQSKLKDGQEELWKEVVRLKGGSK